MAPDDILTAVLRELDKQRPDMDPDRFELGDAIDDDASHAEEQRRHAATRWAEGE